MTEIKELTQRQRQAVTLKEAHGQITVLAVGITDYDKQSGFTKLKTCSNDAKKLRDIFHDVWQLNADKERVKSLTSGGSIPPSKGEIIKAIKSIASLSNADERVLFYFSGHGQRLEDEDGNSKFYLVPQDVYDDNDPEALIDFDKLLKIINEAEAKQKIVIIDACMSGPVATGKKILPAKYSKKFLAEYMKKTTGVAVISSSSFDQSSYTQSPNPKLSLFTYYLIKALGGDPKAQDESMILSINSLFDYISTKVQRRAKSYQKEQLPCIDVKASGIFILGNFSQAIISPHSFDIDGYPISTLTFKDWEPLDVKDVLTEIRRWTAYSQEYLEGKVNDNLHAYLEDELGKKRSSLRKNMGFSPSEIGIEENCIVFPGGSYEVEYKSDNKKSGKLICSLEIENDWFERPSDVSLIVDSLGMSPDEMVFELSIQINPESLIPGLESRGWSIQSELDWKIVAKVSSYTFIAENDRITLKGFLPNEIFGDDSDKQKVALASNALALIAGNS